MRHTIVVIARAAVEVEWESEWVWAFLFSFPFPTNKRDDHLTDALAVRAGRMLPLHPAHQRRTVVGLLLVCALPRSAARYRCWHHFRPHKMQRALPRTHALNCSGTTRLPFFLPWLLFEQLEINWFYARMGKVFYSLFPFPALNFDVFALKFGRFYSKDSKQLSILFLTFSN